MNPLDSKTTVWRLLDSIGPFSLTSQMIIPNIFSSQEAEWMPGPKVMTWHSENAKMVKSGEICTVTVKYEMEHHGTSLNPNVQQPWYILWSTIPGVWPSSWRTNCQLTQLKFKAWCLNLAPAWLHYGSHAFEIPSAGKELRSINLTSAHKSNRRKTFSIRHSKRCRMYKKEGIKTSEDQKSSKKSAVQYKYENVTVEATTLLARRWKTTQNLERSLTQTARKSHEAWPGHGSLDHEKW